MSNISSLIIEKFLHARSSLTKILRFPLFTLFFSKNTKSVPSPLPPPIVERNQNTKTAQKTQTELSLSSFFQRVSSLSLSLALIFLILSFHFSFSDSSIGDPRLSSHDHDDSTAFGCKFIFPCGQKLSSIAVIFTHFVFVFPLIFLD